MAQSTSSFKNDAFDESIAHETVILYNSVRNNEQHLVSLSLDRGAEVDTFCEKEPVDMRTPLRAACAMAKIKVVRTLLSRRADLFAHFGRDRWSALHSAARAGHDHLVKLLLLEAHVLHENVEIDGFFMVHLLIECLNTNLVNGGVNLLPWLLKRQPSLHIDARSRRRGYIDWTPLHMASARGWVGALVFLLRAGAELDARTGEFFVGSQKVNAFAREAATECQVASIEPSFHSVAAHWFDEGLLPIHLAAFGGHLHAFRVLLRHGQSINATTLRHRWTPLMFAIFSGNTTLIREVCRLGGRYVVNFTDRRTDGSEWTPLALAVCCCSPEVVETLVGYGADPLVRLGSADFPGQALVDHGSRGLADASSNHWSGPDGCVSLLHLAVQRGNLDMVRLILSLVRSARVRNRGGERVVVQPKPLRIMPHQDASCPIRSRTPSPSRIGSQLSLALTESRSQLSLALIQGTTRQALSSQSKPATPPSGVASPVGSAARSLQRSGSITRALLCGLDGSHEEQRGKEVLQPDSEGADRDPVAFCTAEGWLPAVLALVLQATDPQRRIRGIVFLESLPDEFIGAGSRADIFLHLLQTGHSLLEDLPDKMPPVVPHNIHAVPETVACRVVDVLVSLCKAGNADRVAYRILHTTLCVACRFDRRMVVNHLLESGLCDPKCNFLRPVECRPLHIATACGFGYLAQLLIQHRADPLEGDEHAELPVFKLTRFYEGHISELQARVAELEAREAQLLEACSANVGALTLSKETSCVGPGLSRIEAALHDSRSMGGA